LTSSRVARVTARPAVRGRASWSAWAHPAGGEGAIAEKADIGKGTFFTYFPTKESVFAQLGENLAGAMERELATSTATVAGAGLEPRILALFGPAIDWHAGHPVLSRYMLMGFMREAACAAADRARLARLHAAVTREADAARGTGEIAPDVDLHAAATAILGTYFGALGSWHATGTASPLASDFERSLGIVIRGLRP
jgi:AcrR family transcriptional regulator